MDKLDLSYAVQTKGNKVVTTSQHLSEIFGKRHADVLRAIRTAIEDLQDPNFIERNFASNEITTLKGKETSHYELTRDAFTIVAMGFTGTKAMQFKKAYIEAFNKMEQILLEGQKYQCPRHDQKVIERHLSMAEAFVSYPILEEKAIDMTRFLHKMRKALDYGPTGVMTMYCSRHFGISPAEVKVIARGKLSFFRQSDLERVVDVLMRQKRMGTFKKPEMGSSLEVYRPAAAKK